MNDWNKKNDLLDLFMIGIALCTMIYIMAFV